MLELRNVSLQLGREGHRLLNEVSTVFPQAHFAAVIGPSGCGKSTLLKVIAGLREPTEGTLHWEGRDLAHHDLDPHETGYVPQFSIAYDLLTVRESVESALRLRVAIGGDACEERVAEILNHVGLGELRDRRVQVLSGGQKRRLALAMEMVTSPILLLADEVTSGLDPKAEDEIVRLMKRLSSEDERIVLSVTHSLRHAELYDSVLVLHQGRLAYHGPANLLYHYFSVHDPDDLFPRLAERSPDDWHDSWEKYREAFKFGAAAGMAPAGPRTESLRRLFRLPAPKKPEGLKHGDLGGVPGSLTQFGILLARRWRLFLRDKGQVFLNLALLFGFPCLVVIFAWDGLPQIKNLSMGSQTNMLRQLAEQASYQQEAARTGGLVSGLVMFQVVLLTLMGSNNSAREIAGERLVFEKEKYGGVRPVSYVMSKAAFLAALVAAQSLWMAVFVNVICHFPGDFVSQLGLLALVNAAMTSVCLGISSLARTAEQASLISVYLVGFQLPLSGAVLALPGFIGWITRPFIAAYWSWSGFLQSMKDTRVYDIVQDVTRTHLSAVPLCFWVLGSHVVSGLVLAYIGSRNSRWE